MIRTRSKIMPLIVSRDENLLSQDSVEEEDTEEIRRGGRAGERGPANIWIVKVTNNYQFVRD